MVLDKYFIYSLVYKAVSNTVLLVLTWKAHGLRDENWRSHPNRSFVFVSAEGPFRNYIRDLITYQVKNEQTSNKTTKRFLCSWSRNREICIECLNDEMDISYHPSSTCICKIFSTALIMQLFYPALRNSENCSTSMKQTSCQIWTGRAK